VVATPVPDIGILSRVFPLLSVSKMLPLALPAELGLNDVLKLVFCPAANVSGVDNPDTLNPGPL